MWPLERRKDDEQLAKKLTAHATRALAEKAPSFDGSGGQGTLTTGDEAVQSRKSAPRKIRRM